jgi:hypothetical protein
MIWIRNPQIKWGFFYYVNIFINKKKYEKNNKIN